MYYSITIMSMSTHTRVVDAIAPFDRLPYDYYCVIRRVTNTLGEKG